MLILFHLYCLYCLCSQINDDDEKVSIAYQNLGKTEFYLFKIRMIVVSTKQADS